MPTKEGYNFDPPRREYFNVKASQANQDYAATIRMLTISGQTGIPGVLVSASNGGGSDTTDSQGRYSVKVPYGWGGEITLSKAGYEFDPPSRSYTHVTTNIRDGLPEMPMRAERLAYGRATGTRYGRTTGRTDRGKVLVIPTAEVRLEEFDAITQDMQVMLYILEKELQKPRLIQGVFLDYGDFFDQNAQMLQALYVQDYGAFFFMATDMPLASSPQPKQPQAEKTQQHIDPVWQQAQREIFNPQAPGGVSPYHVRPQYTPDSAEELKKDFIRILRHAANIRNLKPDEWVTLTVIGRGAEVSRAFGADTYGPVGAEGMQQSGAEEPAPAQPEEGSNTAGYGGMYGIGGYGGGYGVMGGYGGSGGYGGFGGGYGGYGGYGGFAFGSATGFARTDAGPRTFLILRAKKSEVDAFAKGDIDFEQFRQKVKIFTY